MKDPNKEPFIVIEPLTRYQEASILKYWKRNKQTTINDLILRFEKVFNRPIGWTQIYKIVIQDLMEKYKRGY